MAPKPRRSGRPKRTGKGSADPVPDVYKDMLAEVSVPSKTDGGYGSPALKRRRTGARGAQAATTHGSFRGLRPGSMADETDSVSHKSGLSEHGQTLQLHLNRQTTYASSSDGSQFEDVDWEEIALEEDSGSEHEIAPLDLTLNPKTSSDQAVREKKRKPITAAEREVRINVHKMHLLCLIAHLRIRNAWCNDKQVQASLKPLLTTRTLSYLNPDPKLSQFQQTRSFIDGLEQVSLMWKSKFNRTARGLRKALWAENEEILAQYKLPDDMDEPLDLDDFRRVAQKREGSRDIGAQLFCALLRSAGVETRLVCSLQPLSFTSNTGKMVTPKKPLSNVIYADSVEELEGLGGEPSFEKGTNQNTGAQNQAGSSPLVPKRAKRLGLPAFGVDRFQEPNSVLRKEPPKKRFRESKYPIYWVEAFNRSSLKWIPVDSLVTQTIGKPTKFEPPMVDAENTMTYVLAFNNDRIAKDVTRRYAKAYNAKVRKQRVEILKNGDRWWWKTLRRLQNPWDTNIDQIEDAELAAAEAQEPMPKNVQDFKDHPHYALERHLRRHEVIHPKVEIGKVATGKLSTVDDNRVVEPIYRRAHVLSVKSADRWYRQGREIKPGEQPLKYAAKRRNKSASPIDENESYDEGDPGVGLYAEFQTVLYEAPPVVNGRVPKNSYGNLDLYVQSMVPKGGVHIAFPDAAKAARIIGVDYADAVTGFEFKGRHGTAVVRGIVAAKEYQEAILQVIVSMNDERVEVEQQVRTLEAIRLWRRFFAGLKIRERVQGYEIEGEDQALIPESSQPDEHDAAIGGGGFMPDQDEMEIAQPTAGNFFPQEDDMVDDQVDDNDGGGFYLENFEDEVHQPYYTAQQRDLDPLNVTASKISSQQGHSPPNQPPLRSRYHLKVRPSQSKKDLEENIEMHGAVLSQMPTETIKGANHEELLQSGVITTVVTGSNEQASEPQLDSGQHIRTPSHLESSTEQARAVEDPMPVDSESDSLSKGSLLSHDPDDDEADPEWLYDSN